MREQDFDYQHEYQQARDSQWYAPIRNAAYLCLSIPIIILSSPVMIVKKIFGPRNKPNKLEEIGK